MTGFFIMLSFLTVNRKIKITDNELIYIGLSFVDESMNYKQLLKG